MSLNKRKLKTFFLFLFLTVTNLDKKLKVAFLPKHTFFQTWTKAPIAHKSWSKEQYAFPFFSILIKFSMPLDFYQEILNKFNNDDNQFFLSLKINSISTAPFSIFKKKNSFLINLLCFHFLFKKKTAPESHLLVIKSTAIDLDAPLPLT